MKISPVGLSYKQYPSSRVLKSKTIQSARLYESADIFCFTGKKKFSKKIGIIQSTNPTELEKNIQSNLGVEPIDSEVKKFKNGETYVNIKDKVRGKDVYLMQANSGSVNDNLMEMYLKADAAKRAGANKVIAVMPNFDYARQERKTERGEAIAAKLNMDLLKTAGVDEIITEDLHSPAIEGFADSSLKVTHLESMSLIKEYIQSKNLKDIVVVSPDIGGVKRVDKLSKALDCDKAVVYKHRKVHNEAIAEDIFGDVEEKHCIIYDDMIDTAGTIAEVCDLLTEKGAKDIYVCATHGLFNGEAMQKLTSPAIKEVIVTNSVPKKDNELPKIKHIDISGQIIDAIKQISEE